MAALRSLGLHTPAALQYLVAESILSADSTERDYTWETYYDPDDEHTDQIVTTEYHVAWTRGGLVRKIFNFTVEQEKVIQALLTWFPTEEPAEGTSKPSSDPTDDPDASATWHQSPRMVEGRARALVVILKSQAHVFFLSGATHVVHIAEKDSACSHSSSHPPVTVRSTQLISYQRPVLSLSAFFPDVFAANSAQWFLTGHNTPEQGSPSWLCQCLVPRRASDSFSCSEYGWITQGLFLYRSPLRARFGGECCDGH
jgi:hypothetical protein